MGQAERRRRAPVAAVPEEPIAASLPLAAARFSGHPDGSDGGSDPGAGGATAFHRQRHRQWLT
jgi:hypothetical protein